jgi:nicotinate-nucleotide pyrophosphorylase (carboxylating)
VGGAANHRIGLFDGVLIKDNHVTVCGGVAEAVKKARENIHHLVRIEVEVSDLAGVTQALEAGADVILLDNMDLAAIKEAVTLVNNRALVEVSGRITRSDLKILADAGVDVISSGAVTHSAGSVDINMTITANE